MKKLEQDLERWARWRDGGPSVLGYPRSVIGRMIDGLPSNKCIACDGVGRVPGTQQGAAMQYTSCAICGGAGKVDLKPSPHCVNPAFIHSTVAYISDEYCERIDYAICQLTTPKAVKVLIIEYGERGTQAAKAKSIGISTVWYEKILQAALKELSLALG